MSTPTPNAMPTNNGQPANSDNPPASQEPTGGQSGNYTPPASQADLDRIVADRISRERAKFADYDDLKAAAQRLAEIEEANKTEAEKAAAHTAALEAKVKEYETREQVAAWKAEVSKETGVPAVALAGSTKEEIEAHAETLQSLIPKSTTPAPLIIPSQGETPPALNSSALEESLRKAVGATS